MPNASNVVGLKPIRNAGSGPYNDGVNMYFVDAADATPLYIGSPVVLSGSAGPAGNPGVKHAVAGGPITGVVVGFMPDGTTDLKGFRAASTAAHVLVNDDPNTEFEVQEDGAQGATLAVADVGLNADISIGATNGYTRRSTVTLKSSSKAATATLPLRIVGLMQRPDNALGVAAKWRVRINNHTSAQPSAGL